MKRTKFPIIIATILVALLFFALAPPAVAAPADPAAAMDLPGIIRDFAQDPRTLSLAGLIVLDLVFGLASAIKRRVFEWGKLAQFYVSNVIPYILGYAVVWTLLHVGLGEFLGVAEPIIQWIMGGSVGVTLLASIIENAKELGYKPPDK